MKRFALAAVALTVALLSGVPGAAAHDFFPGLGQSIEIDHITLSTANYHRSLLVFDAGPFHHLIAGTEFSDMTGSGVQIATEVPPRRLGDPPRRLKIDYSTAGNAFYPVDRYRPWNFVTGSRLTAQPGHDRVLIRHSDGTANAALANNPTGSAKDFSVTSELFEPFGGDFRARSNTDASLESQSDVKVFHINGDRTVTEVFHKPQPAGPFFRLSFEVERKLFREAKRVKTTVASFEHLGVDSLTRHVLDHRLLPLEGRLQKAAQLDELIVPDPGAVKIEFNGLGYVHDFLEARRKESLRKKYKAFADQLERFTSQEEEGLQLFLGA
jgi:hypothetical protein